MAGVLSFILPGMGQLYLGRPARGLLLLAAALTDIVAIVHFAGSAGGRHLLLIIYLGIALPVIYFYSMLDVLQGTSRAASGKEEEVDVAGLTPLRGAALIAVGLLLLALLKPPYRVEIWLEAAGDLSPGAGMLAVGVVLFGKRGSRMYRIGRITASVLFVSVGAILLLDRIQGRNDIALLGQWWPVVFILLGMEIVGVTLKNRKLAKRIAFDFGGLFAAIVIAVAAYGVTQYAALPFKWIDQLKVDLGGAGGLTEEKGFHYTDKSETVELAAATRSIDIVNPNGRVTVRQGDGDRLQVESDVWVDTPDKAEADRIADASAIEISGSDKLKIEAKGKLYGSGGKWKPRMNLIVTLPKSAVPSEEAVTNGSNTGTNTGSNTPASNEVAPDSFGSNSGINNEAGDGNRSAAEQPMPGIQEITVHAVNGAVAVSGLTLREGLAIHNTDGKISVAGLKGNLKAETKNGGVQASDITGTIGLKTFNGDAAARQIGGDAVLSTSNGSIEFAAIQGNVEADTENGGITGSEVMASVNADTLNGEIKISSSAVGGAWDVGSSVGEIRLFLPENGNYSVSGSVTFGRIETDLPLTVSEKVIRGSVGEGSYHVNIDANNSITVNKLK
jgi:hypothetical protein